MATHTSEISSAKSRLVEFVGVFTFDLSIGQKCEYLYPENGLCCQDLQAVAMLSFPDSQSLSGPSNMDCCYAYTFYPSNQQGFVATYPEGLQCYVYFRQVEDATSPRGYYQKSIVVMSCSSAVFSNSSDMFSLVRCIGQKFYIAEKLGTEKQVLQDAYEEDVGKSDLLRHTSSVSTHSSDGQHDDTILHSMVESLWHLWECLLTGIPILVYAPGDPELCSKSVIAISSLIDPIQYLGSVIPLLSLFDRKYTEYRQRTELKDMICGITSPMALSQLSALFPICLYVTKKSVDNTIPSIEGLVPVIVSKTSTLYVSDCISSVSSGTRNRVSSLSARLSVSADNYRLTIPSDFPTLAKRLVSGFNGNGHELNRNSIRKYFFLLTRDFILPFLPYIQADESAVKQDPVGTETAEVLQWSESIFFSKKISSVGHFASLSNLKIESLYRQFFFSASFGYWLRTCQKDANFQAVIHHCEQLSIIVADSLWTSPLDLDRLAQRVVNLQHRIGDISSREERDLSKWHQKLNSILDCCTRN